jgi:hypothetical protein
MKSEFILPAQACDYHHKTKKKSESLHLDFEIPTTNEELSAIA